MTAQAAAANDNAAAKARAGWSALSAQGAAQEKATLAAERAAAQWRNLSAQGAAQGRALENLRAANDNVATSFATQGAQIGALLPGYSKLIALAGALGAVFTAGQFIQTVTSFQAIDASLKAATGSTEAAQSALAFIRAESDRLGLSLGSTAKDFASFAASTRGTELEGEKARKVFSSIAEAGTVLGLSADDMSGALLALSQMASKGTVSSEELRGQLGERLPGAFNIAAKAMGVTTAELGKMLESGQVLASDFLPKFADEMHRVFGPEAANASNNLQANINRLQTAITDLFLAAGKGGLTEALNDATRQATTFLKASQDAAMGFGGALASGIRAAGGAFEFLRRNSDLAGAGLAALIALRFGPSVVEIAASIARAIAAMGVYDVATKSLVASQTAAVASSRALSIAMGAFGGPIGLALTAAAAGVAYLALRQDEGSKSAEAQAASVKTLDAALAASKGSLAGAADETKRLAAEQLTAAQAGVAAAQARLQVAEAEQARVRAQAGGGGVDAFFYEGLNTAVADRDAARAADDLSAAKERLSAVLRLLAGAATDADRALLGLPSTIAAGAAAAEAALPKIMAYGDALAKLIAMAPQLQQAVDAAAKAATAQAEFNRGTVAAEKAYLAGEINQNDMVDRKAKIAEAYKAATDEVTGYGAALKKVQSDERAAAIAGMDDRQAAIAKLNDAQAEFVKSLSVGANTAMSAAQRNEIVARSEATLAQQVANTNREFDEREAKKAGVAATREAGKAAREAAREFEAFRKQAEAAFEKLFPEEALKRKGAELQKQVAEFGDRLTQIDPRFTEAMKVKIGLNLDGKDIETVKTKTDDLASEISSTFRGVFDDMFSSANKGFDGLLNNFTRGLSRIGTRGIERNLINPLFTGEAGGSGIDFSADGLGKLVDSVKKGFENGYDTTFKDWLKPRTGSDGKSLGFASSPLGSGLLAAGTGAAIGYQSRNPVVGALGGAVSGFATGGPVGAVVGGFSGLIGGLLGKSEAKKAAAKKLREQLEAYKEAYRQAEPEIKKLEATFRGESVGNVGGQIDAAFQQAVQANKTASQAGDQKRADAIMVDFTKYAFRLRDVFMHAFEGTLAEVAAGFGTSGPFAQANAAISTLGESLKAFVKDAESLPDAAANTARARAAAQQAALAALDPPKALSDTQSRLAAIQGTAAGLSRVLQDLGMSADEAAKAIADRTTKAMDALRAQFSADLGSKINDAAGKSYLNDIADLVKERDGLLADAKAIGADTAQVGRYFSLAAQKIVDGSELTGDAFTALVRQFPALKGAVVEFGQAIDTAAAKAEAAARALGYQDRAFAAGNDTSTLAGALAAQDRKAAQDRAAEAKAGGRAMADLEKALAAERTAIIKDFAARAAEAEAAAREAGARRVLSAEDRIFAARNDASTLAGKLAEMDRQHAQERLDEAAAGGQAMAKLEEAQAAERLKIVREAGAAEVAARKQALAEAQTFLDGATKNIRTYLDGLKAGPATNLSPGDRLKEAQAQFDAQMKLAKGGDRDALSSITTYADRLLDAGKGQFASGKGYQDILGAVTKQLGALPSQVSAEQFIVDAIKAQTMALQSAIGTGSASEIAKALKGDFTSLDTNTDGLLSQAEFLRALGPKATVEEQRKALLKFAEIDLNGDGQLSKLELLIAETKGGLAAAKASEVAKALSANFNKLDANTNGLISQKEFLAALGPKATVAEQQEALKVFRSIDIDGDGQISKLELLRAELGSNLAGINGVSKAVNDNFSRLDKNGSGGLSLAEFKAAFGPLATKADQKLAEAYFKNIDADGDGIISRLELTRVDLVAGLKANAPALVAKALKDYFPTIDVNSDGGITYAEYVQALGPLATKAEQQAAKKVFDAIDADGNGIITKAEAVRVDLLAQLKANDPGKMGAAIAASFKTIDLNADAKIDWNEYVKAVGPATKAEQAAAKAVFDRIDADGNGVITAIEAANSAIAGAVKANSASAFAAALNANFSTLDKSVNGILDKAELQDAIKGLSTAAEQRIATDWIKALDANGDGQLTQAELTAGRMFDLKGLVGGTTKAVNDNKTATDAATGAVKDGNGTAAASKALLDSLKGFAADQKTILTTIQGYQNTAKDTLTSLKTSGGLQEEQLRLLNKQFTLASPVRVSGTSTVLNNGMIDALNKIVFNTGQTVNGLIKLMSTNRPDGLLYAFAEGGWVRGPGTGTSDSIGAKLSNGEFVVNAAAARLNAPFLQAMNDNPGMVPAVPMPIPVAGGGMDLGALLSEQRATRDELRSLRADNKALLEMLARVTKTGADKVAGKIEEATDEVAGSREDARRDAAPKRAGRGEPIKRTA
ncbi:tape measure protein [Methylorubrum salsuginis]|uniref:tape measure protein n=1 Tax=Methylorubrum salsuginis TaxID=414703 RepID=UPI0013F4DC27|nr:tape measure protein [Methylorubrum salsuginis]